MLLCAQGEVEEEEEDDGGEEGDESEEEEEVRHEGDDTMDSEEHANQGRGLAAPAGQEGSSTSEAGAYGEGEDAACIPSVVEEVD